MTTGIAADFILRYSMNFISLAFLNVNSNFLVIHTVVSHLAYNVWYAILWLLKNTFLEASAQRTDNFKSTYRLNKHLLLYSEKMSR